MTNTNHRAVRRNAYGRPKMTPQRRKILAALADGVTVTKLTALHQGIGNIADVIMRLRDMGWRIYTRYGYDINGKQYAKYVMEPLHRDAARMRANLPRRAA